MTTFLQGYEQKQHYQFQQGSTTCIKKMKWKRLRMWDYIILFVKKTCKHYLNSSYFLLILQLVFFPIGSFLQPLGLTKKRHLHKLKFWFCFNNNMSSLHVSVFYDPNFSAAQSCLLGYETVKHQTPYRHQLPAICTKILAITQSNPKTKSYAVL